MNVRNNPPTKYHAAHKGIVCTMSTRVTKLTSGHNPEHLMSGNAFLQTKVGHAIHFICALYACIIATNTK